ncbi:hypothetical protein A0256_09955 [Mucilaginibacter sp. PAMC 26640]|nr:hypothetical protein A0256_09955 [Mucilaginibacter sp. PAMC 26640]
MAISLKETQGITEIAQLIYDFLPATPHPYADSRISFPGCADKVGVANLWVKGSKLNAVASLLERTLEYQRGRFCTLIVCIVKTAIVYRQGKKQPLTRETIEAVNQKIAMVGFKIPELWATDFLRSLPSSTPIATIDEVAEQTLTTLKTDFINLNSLAPQPRGYAFQDFLNKWFTAYGLNPKKSFRITGEEIDGSCMLGADTYLIEAKWQAKKSSENELLVFSGKVQGKAAWSRGVFISYAGFTDQGLIAFGQGKSTNLIGMDGQDIYFILDEKMSLTEVLHEKARIAAETNRFFTSAFNLRK